MTTILIVAAATLALYALAIGALVLSGHGPEARALAGKVPETLATLRRALKDPRVTRRHKLMVVALFAYLALPFDLIPDFIPVIGYLDDVILVALVLRTLTRAASPRASS